MSISLNNEATDEIDVLQNELGISGRSELVRLALRKLSSERKERSAPKGIIDAVLLVLHLHSSTDEISKIRHRHGKLIKTQLHSHVSGEKCMEIIVVHGESSLVRKMADEFDASKKTEYVKLIIP